MEIDKDFTYTESLIACPECDLIHSVPSIREGEQGRCVRCGALLFVRHKNSLDRSLAFALTGLMFFILANIFPLLTFEMEGQSESNRLIDGAIAFWNAGYWELGIVVFISSVVAPLAVLLVLITLLLPMQFGRSPFSPQFQIRLLTHLKPWAMSEIFILGIIVAFVKLQDFADVSVGLSLFAFVLMVAATVMAYLTLDEDALWSRLKEIRA
ncbi:paraquat-inducible protein A [Sneathiella sp. CAU 1612]|uniref:Paraquat-inducible protein A n=1 Tax=Sneathiella sedimenti TaxID=2816034 RepID=A0ABS3F5C2_9PROT|nr:paraquat-inducible protein A [Sneathiella sedimenti]MBO0333688.1 paraquat-inducible protein A [Sneathiella sedimenti]